MDTSLLPEDLLPQPGLSFGVGGVEFFSPGSLAEEQLGYEASDWNKSWLVIARDTACGDPIFIDQSRDGLPVYTAMHGMGSWEPSTIANSWAQFLAALDLVPTPEAESTPLAWRRAHFPSLSTTRCGAACAVSLAHHSQIFGIFCLHQLSPNNSFKPKPLRGSA